MAKRTRFRDPKQEEVRAVAHEQAATTATATIAKQRAVDPAPTALLAPNEHAGPRLAAAEAGPATATTAEDPTRVHDHEEEGGATSSTDRAVSVTTARASAAAITDGSTAPNREPVRVDTAPPHQASTQHVGRPNEVAVTSDVPAVVASPKGDARLLTATAAPAASGKRAPPIIAQQQRRIAARATAPEAEARPRTG